MSNIFNFAIFAFLATQPFAFAEQKTFLLYDLHQNDWLIETGPQCDERASPCSTFKIPLSLMGYDSGILINESTPEWPYQEGYTDFLPVWKQPFTPEMWMRYSCVWYSQVLTTHLGMQRFQHYVDAFNYGNKDLSGGLTQAWLMSSLKISPREQICFLSNMLTNKLPLSDHTLRMTKSITDLGQLTNGWELFGKTGSGALQNPELKQGWFVGWMEKENRTVVFAYYLRDDEPVGTFGGPRAKEFAKEILFDFCSKN